MSTPSDPPDDPDLDKYPPPQFAPAAPRPAAAPAPASAAPAPAPTPTWETFTPPQLSPPAPEPPPAPAPVPAPAEPAAAEEPLLPSSFHENDLRTAIGAPPMPEHIQPRRAAAPASERDEDGDEDADDDGDRRRRRRRTVLVLGGSIGGGLLIGALVLLGHLNAARYAITCESKQVIAEQGRAFPPWGMSQLSGDEWKPIKIPPSFQCGDAETEDLAELGDTYRKLLVERAEALLTAREVVQIDDAAAMLEQALLHARGDSEAHKAARQSIQRLLGDVGYWRAVAKLRDATKALGEAAKEYEAAAAQLPRHVSDAGAWATYVRKLIDELQAGPVGARSATASAAIAPIAPGPPLPERPPAPPGVALPVEPAPAGANGSGSASEVPPPPPDAGVASGGVLL